MSLLFTMDIYLFYIIILLLLICFNSFSLLVGLPFLGFLVFFSFVIRGMGGYVIEIFGIILIVMVQSEGLKKKTQYIDYECRYRIMDLMNQGKSTVNLALEIEMAS